MGENKQSFDYNVVQKSLSWVARELDSSANGRLAVYGWGELLSALKHEISKTSNSLIDQHCTQMCRFMGKEVREISHLSIPSWENTLIWTWPWKQNKNFSFLFETTKNQENSLKCRWTNQPTKQAMKTSVLPSQSRVVLSGHYWLPMMMPSNHSGPPFTTTRRGDSLH